MTLRPYQNYFPALAQGVFVDESAVVIGQVELGEDCSVWPVAVIRGDMQRIRIGARTSVQDGAVLHITHASKYNPEGFALTLGEDVTVGHQAMLHGCSIGDGSLVGIQAVVLNGARIGRRCIVGAGALVTEGKEFADGSLIVGAPAKAVRALSAQQFEMLKTIALGYVDKAARHRDGLKRIG